MKSFSVTTLALPLSLALSSFLTTSLAQAATENIITCETPSNAQDIVVSVRGEGAELFAYVSKDGSEIAKVEVREIVSGRKTSYLDTKGNFGLFLSLETNPTSAKLMYIDAKGSDSINQSGFVCYEGR